MDSFLCSLGRTTRAQWEGLTAPCGILHASGWQALVPSVFCVWSCFHPPSPPCAQLSVFTQRDSLRHETPALSVHSTADL